MVRVRGIEPRSRVWKTHILTAVLHPLVVPCAVGLVLAELQLIISDVKYFTDVVNNGSAYYGHNR